MTAPRTLMPVADARQTAAGLGRALRTHRLAAAVTVVAFVASAGFGLMAPLVLGGLVDDTLDGAGTQALPRTVVLLVVSAVGAGATLTVGVMLMSRVAEAVLASLREQVVTRSLRLRSTEVEATGSGDLLSRVGDDVSVVTQAISTTVPQVVQAAAVTVVTLGGIFGLDWRLGLAGLLALPVYVHGVRWYLPRSGPMYAAERRALGERAQALVGAMSGADTLRAYRAEAQHVARVDERSAEARDISIDVFHLLTRFGGSMNRAELLALSAILVTGFWLVDADAITVGAATAAAWFFHRLFGPLGTLMMTFDSIQSAGASLARLVGVIDMPLPDEPAKASVPRDSGVVVAKVSHAYDDGPLVLHEVDLEVRPGEKVALVGATGAGKTTLASVVAGQVLATDGTVRVGDVPQDELGDRGLRRHVALVSQDVHVFAGTLGADARLGRPDATDDEVLAALDLVGATSWVSALPDGLATVVGEGGHDLSAPQAQQLALARLVLVDPPVVILDEATAEAGSAGAHDLEAAASAATAGRTSIVVAHRLTQAATADRVVVLDAGRVVEQGTHAELVAAGGRYARLWSAWSDT
ncbi:ABC transporter ATP-binding protein [Solicola sp. PLA-1-18]|uniref:ABC transporter ATP-binding protein n=1 Tax=Solicola sp. PLA-1-18 TaxID=3380532 RepID=UPI003B7DB220